jgi:hypothetical protein
MVNYYAQSKICCVLTRNLVMREGCAGAQMAEADGRELWLLAERYQIKGIKEWLMKKGIDEEGLFAAAQYAM